MQKLMLCLILLSLLTIACAQPPGAWLDPLNLSIDFTELNISENISSNVSIGQNATVTQPTQELFPAMTWSDEIIAPTPSDPTGAKFIDDVIAEFNTAVAASGAGPVGSESSGGQSSSPEVHDAGTPYAVPEPAQFPVL